MCDADACARAGWPLVDFAAACLQGGARWLQVRAKRGSSQELFAASTAIVEQARRAGAAVVMNDRADLAKLVGAAGVHVGQDDLSPVDVRRVVGSAAIVGLSTHTDDQLLAAMAEPISYVAVGPVFTTATKTTGYEAVGLGHVRHAAARVAAKGLPVVAIGGIDLGNARSVIEAGAQSVAVISDLLVTRDPTTRVREFLAELG